MGLELLNEMNKKIEQSETALSELQKNGRQYAEAERNYKIALRQKILELRAEGEKVTIIRDLATGDDDVAEKRMERDIAEASYKTSQDKLNLIKLHLRILQAQFDKEWSNE